MELESAEATETRFDELDLSSAMRKALHRAGYELATPIQASLIPVALDGRDVLGQSRTGTGKTAAFAIPLIEMLERRGRGPQAITLAPTRELVRQIVEEFEKLSRGQNVRTCGLYGGEPIEKQLKSLERGVDLIVGTPGRVIDHLNRGTLVVDDLYHVVLDEADRMLDIGFRPDIERILKRVPQPHQTLLLSATIDDEIRRLARKYMYHPVELNLSRDEPSVDTIQQFRISVDPERKFDLLVRLLEQEQPAQCIIFTRTKRGADRLAQRLERRIPETALIHGDLPQRARNRVMKAFRDQSIHILVATDVVGRGIDVEGISHVINYDIPEDPENYLHRIGRTGRMGRDGISYLFVTPEEGTPLTAIELLIQREIPSTSISGFSASVRTGTAQAPPQFRELFSGL